MNEQTKLELLKIAAQLTTAECANTKKSSSTIISSFNYFANYLISNYETLGVINAPSETVEDDINQEDDDYNVQKNRKY